MGEKVKTIMVLKVDLQCYRCYKKVKKVLCKFPQIQDQIYDEKANTVTIKVVCCSPEKIRGKICCKGGGSIKSIEIKPPPPPPKPKSKEPEKKDGKKDEPKREPPPIDTGKIHDTKNGDKYEKKPEKPKEIVEPKEPPLKPPVPALPPPMAYPPIGFGCTECYYGHEGAPCYFGGQPPPPFPCYETYGRPVYESWGGGDGYKYRYVSHGDCFSEENSQACSIM